MEKIEEFSAIEEFAPVEEFPAAPAPVGTLRGLASSLQAGGKRIAGLADVAVLAGTRDLAKPTVAAERKAFVRALSDPRYGDLAIRDPRRAEALYGPAAQLEDYLRPGRLLQQFTAEDVARREADIAALPRSAAQQELAAAPTTSAKWAAWRKNPIELTAGIALESLPPSLAGALTGTAIGGPGVGTAAGAGMASGLMTFSSELLGAAAERYDVKEPEQLQAFLNDSAAFDAALNRAVTKSGIVAPIDAATAGQAGRFIGPALKEGLRRTLLASGKELGMQVAGGSGGELMAQAASGQPIDTFDVAMEGLAELGSAPVEIASNVRQARRQATAPPRATSEPQTFSEFGSEAEFDPLPAPRSPQPIEEFSAKEVATAPAETALTPPVSTGATPPAQATAAPEQTTVPELPETLTAQVAKLRAGKAPAVLFTPADTVPEWATQDQRFDIYETGTGFKVVYDTAALTKDEIHRAIFEDRIGDILGYGVPTKPTQPTAAVVVRDRAGLELRSVLVDEATLPAAQAAAQAYADAAAGETVTREDPAAVLAKRLDRTGAPAAARTYDAAEAAREYAAGRAARQARAAEAEAAAPAPTLPADIEQQLDSVWQQAGLERPRPKPTPASPAVTVTERHLAEAREAVAQMRGEQTERAPDVFDALDDVTSGPIQFPADMAGALESSRERVAQAVHQKPWKRLSSKQRKAIDRGLRVSTAEGFAADEALTGLGEKYAGLSLDDFANALLDAGEARLLQRSPGDSAEVQQLAREIAEAEAAASPVADDIPFSLDKPTGPPESEHTDGRTKEKTDVSALQVALTALGFKGRVTPAAHPQPAPDLQDASDPRTAAGNALILFARIFRRRLVLFHAAGDTSAINGLVLPSDPRTLYLNADARHTPFVVLGHEFLESFRLTHPEVYQALAAHLRPLLRNVEEYRQRLDTARGEQPFQGRADTALAEKEIIADALGDALAKPGFWKRLGNERPDLFRAVANAFRNFLNWVLTRLGSFNSNRYVADIAKAEQMLANALAEVAQSEDAADASADAPQFSLALPRATGEKIRESTAISDQTKAAILEYVYDPRSNLTDKQQAIGIVQQHGVAAALQLWRNPGNLPGAVRSKLLGAITQHLANAERAARANGDTAAADALMTQQADLWNEALPQITNTAQELQALNDLVAMSPDAHVERARREVQRAGDTAVERHKGETDAMRQALEQGRSEGVEAVRRDPATNQAAREAVDDAVKNSEETNRAVIMELAGPFAQIPAVVDHARRVIGEKTHELLNRVPRPNGFTVAEHTRKILDDLAQRAAEIFAGHIQGAEPELLLVDKLRLRLGVDRDHATKLASALSKEWDRQLAAARKNLDTRLANARVRQERREREAESNAAVDRALRKQLRELNLKLGEAIRQAAADRQRTAQTIADKIVAASGLTGEKAEALRQKLTTAWNTKVSAAQQRALDAIANRAEVKISRRMRTAFDRLVELDRLAPVDGDAFFKAVRAALKLPELTDKQAKELRQMVLDAQAKPEGRQQQQAQAKLETFLKELRGEWKWHDAPMAFWYSNLFSNPLSWTANGFGNWQLRMGQLATEIVKQPQHTNLILRAYTNSIGYAYVSLWDTLRTGETRGLRLAKAEPARWLEAKHLPGHYDYLLTKWRIPSRALAGQDIMSFTRLAELKWNLLALEKAKQTGKRGEQLAQEVQNLLFNTQAHWDAARLQASNEGLTGREAYLRAHEIIEQQREQTLPGSAARARQYGLDNTLNKDYEGFLGSVGEWLEAGNRNLVFTRFGMPVVKYLINSTQKGIEYSPLGYGYAIKGKWTGMIRRRAVKPDELADLTIHATIGTLLIAGFVAYLLAYKDDDDPPFWLYGAGPRNKTRRQAWTQSTGAIPYSLKTPWGYVSYQENPAAPLLAVLGNYFDGFKFGNLEEQDNLSRTAAAFRTIPDVLLHKRVTQGLQNLTDLLDKDKPLKKVMETAGRTASTFVVGQDLRMIDQLFDPNVYTPGDVQTALLASWPVARRQGNPDITALGDVVERSPDMRFFSRIKEDPLARLLIAKRAWPSLPDQEEASVGNPRLGPDYQRPMTPDEYYAWIAESGPEIRRRLTERLDHLAGLPDAEAQAYVRRIAGDVRTKTKPR